MGYLHIDNLSTDNRILETFKELYALEKIHGTSAHINYNKGKILYFSGGCKRNEFLKLFDEAQLLERFDFLCRDSVIVYGEAYGGKLQGMSKTYGNTLKFIVFDIKVNNMWLDVPRAEKMSNEIGLEFVYYKKIPSTIEAINAERDAESKQAIRNGMGSGHIREGVVLRPTIELLWQSPGSTFGKRMIAKHKRVEFSEMLAIAKSAEFEDFKSNFKKQADAISKKYVTEMRIRHILDEMKSNGISVSINSDFVKTAAKNVYINIRNECRREIKCSQIIRDSIIEEATIVINNFLPYWFNDNT